MCGQSLRRGCPCQQNASIPLVRKNAWNIRNSRNGNGNGLRSVRSHARSNMQRQRMRWNLNDEVHSCFVRAFGGLGGQGQTLQPAMNNGRNVQQLTASSIPQLVASSSQPVNHRQSRSPWLNLTVVENNLNQPILVNDPEPENCNIINIQMGEKRDKKSHAYMIFTELAQGSCFIQGKTKKGKEKMACYEDLQRGCCATTPDVTLRLGVSSSVTPIINVDDDDDVSLDLSL